MVRMRKLGVSLSYGGAYVGYYYGVYEYLHETFDLSNVAFFAGISAGCQVAYWMACGVEPSTAWDACFIPTMQSGCTVASVPNSAHSSYYPELYTTALDHMKRLYDPSMLVACNRSLFVGVTVLETMQKATLSQFEDPTDLLHAVLASQCIPFLFDTHVTIRGVSYIDGALSHHAPYEPCEAHWIHISVFKWESLHILGSLVNLHRLPSVAFHCAMKQRGYDAAKRRKSWLMRKGLRLHPLMTQPAL